LASFDVFNFTIKILMKKSILSGFILAISLASTSMASLITIGLSPLGTDHAVGLSALNTVGQPASSATGGSINAGVLFDDVSKLLTYNIAYGSDFGFTDLAGNWSNTHVHGPVAVQFPSPNTGAGLQFPLPHTPGSSARTGSFVGSQTLTAGQEADLMSSLLYVNVHSAFSGGGEIRAQLVPLATIPEPGSFSLCLLGLAFLGWVRRR
jgi:hypothetical protein